MPESPGKNRWSGFVVSGLCLAVLTLSPAWTAELAQVKVSKDNKGFVLAGSGERFVPWGFNYDHDD